MTDQTKLISPDHALILIMDPEVAILPESMAHNLVASTNSCVAVGTRPALDGPTRVHLSSQSQIHPRLEKVFCGSLETPNKIIKVCGIEGEVELEATVTSERTLIEVWVDDLYEPQNIEIIIQGLP